MKKVLITGGAGFIGSNLVQYLLENNLAQITNLDLLTYAGHLKNLDFVQGNPNHLFIKGDINNRPLIDEILEKEKPEIIIHLAAESHVDRSILSAQKFYQTNVMGTLTLLESALQFWQKLTVSKAINFRFIMVSSDEVYGSLNLEDEAFTENSPFKPRSPYAASKAGADHLAQAFFHTHKLPVITTHCSNNYGPRQFPEKLIPLMILNAIQKKSLPIYGDGQNVRDWLEVSDHCKGLWKAALLGKIGETYNFGGETEYSNKKLVEKICLILAELNPENDYKKLITYIKDRPGHDQRYAVNIQKAKKELNWEPEINFKKGLKNTIKWYLQNSNWLELVPNKVL